MKSTIAATSVSGTTAKQTGTGILQLFFKLLGAELPTNIHPVPRIEFP